MMDDIAKYNQAQWDELAQANVVFSRPFLDLDPQSAREVVDPQRIMGDVTGKDVLCLASGGGQQSVAFALLGARVTVFDLSATQLQRDQEAAAHYQVRIQAVQGDMRDLSRFGNASFDIVWHAYSINFVPDARVVFREVARVLRPAGLYRIECSNPFFAGVSEEDWNGSGYPLTRPYIDGAELEFADPDWTVDAGDGTSQRVKGPREFRHTLSTVVNGLIEQGFVMLGVWEESSGDPAAEPGTWEHLKAVAPPWLTFWAIYRPDIFKEMNSPS
ncbi:MAG: class I SAM-dependent methyltransferase [Chloroflexota bacterium]|nr:class I SAM-dependent methyltransferase [Chloroflexota bacterium]